MPLLGAVSAIDNDCFAVRPALMRHGPTRAKGPLPLSLHPITAGRQYLEYARKLADEGHAL